MDEEKDSTYFGEYLKKVRKQKGYSIRKVEQKTGISNSYLSQLENGKRGTPSIEMINKLSNALDVPFNSMLQQATGDTFVVFEEEERKQPGIIHVPVVGTIPAGRPILAEENIKEWMDIPNMDNLEEDETFVLNVEGDSMIGSRIYEGDQVVVKKTIEVQSGDIAVVNVNGHDATLKKIKKDENAKVTLIPTNEKYPPIEINNEDARIIGKVVRVMFSP